MNRDSVLNEKVVGFDSENEKLIYKLGEINFYTNEKLKDDTMEVIFETPLGNKYKNKLKKYFENNIIIPVRYNRNYFDHLFYKTKVFFLNELLGFTSSNIDTLKNSVGGFYCTKRKKVYLIIDNMTNIFSFSKDDSLIQLLLHELSHYCCFNVKNFYDKVKHLIIKWYASFFIQYCVIPVEKVKNYKKDIINIIQKYFIYATNFEKNTINITKEKIEKIFDQLLNVMKELKQYSSLNTKSYDFITYSLMNIVYFSTIGDYNKSVKYIMENKRYLSCCLNSYKILDCRLEPISNTFFYQEFIYPSEIISVSSIESKNADIFMKLL